MWGRKPTTAPAPPERGYDDARRARDASVDHLMEAGRMAAETRKVRDTYLADLQRAMGRPTT